MFEEWANRSFTIADQQRFAALSGDCNPMHLDPLAARRTEAGKPVVHGINAMLWAMEAALAASPGMAVSGISTKFERFIAIDETISLRARRAEATSRLEIRGAAARLMTITLRHQGGATGGGEPLPSAAATRPAAAKQAIQPIPSEPLVLDFAAASRAAGRMAILPNGAQPKAQTGSELARNYPLLLARLGPARLQAIIALSTLVGMVAPGLHSIFFGLDLALDDAAAGGEEVLTYRVGAAHDGLRLLSLQVAGPGVAGKVEAFVRHPQVMQPRCAQLRAMVTSGEFAGVRALVVGGSRGLGEVTAKLLAMGGAQVAISYAVGAGDAEAVAADIRGSGGSCDLLRIDALSPMAPQLAALAFAPDQLYYFATAKIFVQKGSFFSARLLADFHRIYVDGFADLCGYFSGRGAEVTAFYPSSVAVAERPRAMTEYAMAKAAGEVLAEDIDRFLPGLRTLTRRLPRLLTDQTATVTPVETPDAAAVMLQCARAMMALRRR